MPQDLRKRLGPARAVGRTIRAGAGRLRPLFERRRSGRVNAERKVACDKGAVVNLSVGGMRLRSHRRWSGKLDVDLWAASARVTVRAQVIWSRRVGFRRFEVGLKFIEVTPDILRALTTFAT
ncbi:MAG: PilZ domain-containing protein [Planctomycetota bacterium]|jgi:hypothetical protein